MHESQGGQTLIDTEVLRPETLAVSWFSSSPYQMGFCPWAFALALRQGDLA